MSLTNFTIDSVDYTSYATVKEADDYLRVDLTRFTAWDMLQNEDKEIRLINATNRLDLLDWKGTKSGGGMQVNAFPRTGLTYSDGTAVGTNEIPVPVEQATVLLAGTINIDPSHASPQVQTRRISSVRAGTAAVEFESGASTTTGDETPALQDPHVLELIKQFLKTTGTGGGSTRVGGAGSFVSGSSPGSDFNRTGGF